MTDFFAKPNLDLMDQAVLIVLEGEPQGKNRPRFAARNGFVQVFTDDRTKEYEALIQMEVLRIIGGQPLIDQVMSIRRKTLPEAFEAFGHKPLFAGPVRVEMEIAHSIRASWAKKKQEAARLGSIAPTIKIDADNCIKVFCDAFNGIVWNDDVQVIEITARKVFSDSPYVLVKVVPLDIQNA